MSLLKPIMSKWLFRDMFLDRADMWRLARSLRDKTIYVGKRVIFAGSIRNTIKSIYVHSSLSGHDTFEKCNVGLGEFPNSSNFSIGK